MTRSSVGKVPMTNNASADDKGPSPEADALSIVNLGSPDRLAQIPEEYNLNVPEPKGHNGICVGRDEDLKAIHDYFATQYRNERRGVLREDDCVACFITNAPGSGKTTLREEFMDQARKKGTSCIELTPAQLMHPDAFVEGIVQYAARTPKDEPEERKAEGQNIRERLGKAWEKVTGRAPPWLAAMAGVATDLVAEGLGTFVAVGTAQALERKENLAKELIRNLEASGSMMTPETALQILTNTHDGQYILTVDEGQNWADQSLSRDGLHEILSLICNPSARKNLSIRGGGLLISGLGNVKDHVDGLGLSRAKVIWMDELTRADSEAIIRHELKQIDETDLSGERRKRVLKQWPIRLAAKLTHWPQHAAIAGMVANAMILQSKDASEDDDERALEWVLTQTGSEISTLYARQLTKATDDGHDDAPVRLAALAEINGGALPRKAVRMLLKGTLKESGDDCKRADVKELISVMKRTGILKDFEVRLPSGRIRTEYRIGIPSIKNYILHMDGVDQTEHFEWAKAALEGRKRPKRRKQKK